MNEILIEKGSIQIRKSDKFENKLLIGIDQGCSLTKIVCLPKANAYQLIEESFKLVTLEWFLFSNNDFESGLRFIHEYAYIPDGCQLPIHITGVGAFTKRAVIESICGRKVVPIPEELSISAGIIIGFSDIGVENLTRSVIKPLSWLELSNNPFHRHYSKQNETMQSKESDHIYPCVAVQYGSAAGFVSFNEEEKSEIFGVFMQGGKNLLGLAKCLLDTNDYQLLTQMAHEGCRETIDSQLKDFITEDSTKIPMSFEAIPILSFAKCDDIHFNAKVDNKADMARSLIAMQCIQIVTGSLPVACANKVSKIYLNGNLFQSPIFAEELQKVLSEIPIILEFIILDFGYSGALAALLCGPHDKSKYMKC